MDNRMIGVFDSGIGGLTALSDLITKFPHEDFLYLADTLNCPYGIKTKEQLEKIVSDNFTYFEKMNVKAIVIACNTATANSYHIKTNIPTIRIIEPTVEQAKKVGKKIAVLATNFTIDSGIYQRLLDGRAIGVRCSEFVGLVEEGLMDTDRSLKVVTEKLEFLKGQADTVVLGCTHFGLLEKEITSVLGNINIVNSSLAIAPVLQTILNNQTLNANNKDGKVYLKVTGNPNELKINWFNHHYENIEQVKI